MNKEIEQVIREAATETRDILFLFISPIAFIQDRGLIDEFESWSEKNRESLLKLFRESLDGETLQDQKKK